MPDFKKLTMLQSELEGDYRTAHSRLITNRHARVGQMRG